MLELRLLAHAGFMPDLTACSVCGGYDGAPMWFHLQGGVLTCRRCAERQPPDTAPVGGNVLAAMRHILYSPLDKAFSFSMTAEGLESPGERLGGVSAGTAWPGLSHAGFLPYLHRITE